MPPFSRARISHRLWTSAAAVALSVFVTATSATAADSTATPLPPHAYGRHFPNGVAAVDHLYGPNGTWKPLYPAEYIWNYYPDSYYQQNQPNCPIDNAHPYGRDSLIAAADGTRFFTTRDANCHLLLDFNHDGWLDTNVGGYAFHEHNGVGVDGLTLGPPFTNFWFDDNWLARYMSETYARPAPYGLSQYSDFNRWSVLGGGIAGWTPYPASSYIDRIALNGVYHRFGGNISVALLHWDLIRNLSGFQYDSANQRYVYPAITDSYHLGLFGILSGLLLDAPSVPAIKRQELLDHWVSLRSNLLSMQERSGPTLLSWKTGIGNNASLINTETTAVNVLALGAGAVDVFEAGKAPMRWANNQYFLRPHNVLSAVTGLSSPGHISYGPYRQYPLGNYTADFLLRSPPPVGTMATLDVYDAERNLFLAQQSVAASSMVGGNRWTRVSLNFSVSAIGNSLEFRTFWHGTANLDVAAVRVRKR